MFRNVVVMRGDLQRVWKIVVCVVVFSKGGKPIHLHFCVNEEERELIRDRMERTGIISMGAYFRKMAIDGYHINLDLTDVKEMVRLLRNTTNNINQIAKGSMKPIIFMLWM